MIFASCGAKEALGGRLSKIHPAARAAASSAEMARTLDFLAFEPALLMVVDKPLRHAPSRENPCESYSTAVLCRQERERQSREREVSIVQLYCADRTVHVQGARSCFVCWRYAMSVGSVLTAACRTMRCPWGAGNPRPTTGTRSMSRPSKRRTKLASHPGRITDPKAGRGLDPWRSIRRRVKSC